MEGFFDAIFGNFIVIIAIIGGIVGFLKDKSGKESQKENRKPYQVPKPTATPSGGDYQFERQMPTVQANTTMNTTAIEDQQEKQMQQLAERMSANTKQIAENRTHDAIIGDPIKDNKINVSYQKTKMKKQVQNNLTSKGLVDGIVMSEVLGPPRAIRPYQSVIASRRK